MTRKKNSRPEGRRAAAFAERNAAAKTGGDAPKRSFEKGGQRPHAQSGAKLQVHAGAKLQVHAGAQPQAHAQRRGGRERGLQKPPANVAVLYGFHSVGEALASERRVLLRLFATAAAAERLAGAIAARAVPVEIVSGEAIAARLPADAVHQGLLLEARHLEPIDIADLPANALVLVLDQVSDPHNVGAIVRTAAAFGVDAIVTTERHSPEFTGVLAKAASGGLEHVAIASIVNLARGLEELGDMGFLRVGLDSEGPQSLAEVELRRPLALVLGAEGKGLRRLSRENCDVLARLDMPGKIKSLNVSNACAVALAYASLKVPRP